MGSQTAGSQVTGGQATGSSAAGGQATGSQVTGSQVTGSQVVDGPRAPAIIAGVLFILGGLAISVVCLFSAFTEYRLLDPYFGGPSPTLYVYPSLYSYFPWEGAFGAIQDVQLFSTPVLLVCGYFFCAVTTLRPSAESLRKGTQISVTFTIITILCLTPILITGWSGVVSQLSYGGLTVTISTICWQTAYLVSVCVAPILALRATTRASLLAWRLVVVSPIALAVVVEMTFSWVLHDMWAPSAARLFSTLPGMLPFLPRDLILLGAIFTLTFTRQSATKAAARHAQQEARAQALAATRPAVPVQPGQPGYPPVQPGYPPAIPDAPNAGYALIGFLIPLAGLILYLIWKDNTPLRAKSAGKGALISTIIGATLTLIGVIIFLVLAASYG